MRIHHIDIKNFRGIEHLAFDLHPQFNLLIGENGSGKTAILEALTVAMGSFFVGIRGADSRLIRDEDIRIFRTPEGSVEFSPETLILATGKINGGSEITWARERQGIKGKTRYKYVAELKKTSEKLYRSLTDSSRSDFMDMPVLAYYSTARLWKEGRVNQKKEKGEKIVRNIPSRLRGYKDALQTNSTFAIMLKWFEGKFSALRIKRDPSIQLEAVRSVIVRNIPGCRNVYWEFDPDRIRTLYIEFENGEDLPFSYLSDGYRNLLAIFADIAYRCVTLNPHYGAEAPARSAGIVLIDELDLHLHPAWQKTIIKQLRETFPNIQFVTTTHSPFLIQETADGELFRLTNTNHITAGGAEQYSLEDVAEYLQQVSDPAWSLKKKKMYEDAKEYFSLLEQMTPDKNKQELERIRERLNLLGKPYADNVAYIAFLEQKRYLTENKLH